jgi:hypothetical protein
VDARHAERLPRRLRALALLPPRAPSAASRARADLRGGIKVFLRSDVRWMKTVGKGYSHSTIAPVRVAHILSRST